MLRLIGCDPCASQSILELYLFPIFPWPQTMATMATLRVFLIFPHVPITPCLFQSQQLHLPPTSGPGRIPWSTCRSFLQFCKKNNEKEEKEEKEETEVSIDDFEELEVLLATCWAVG